MRLSKLLKTIIFISALFMLRYTYLIPGGNLLGRTTQQGIVAIFGLVMSFGILGSKAGRTIRKESRWLYKYLVPYTMALGASFVYSWLIKGYSLYSVIGGLIPFLMVYLAIPLLYIFRCDGGYLRFVRVMVLLQLGITICKTFGWYFYNYGGPTYFQDLTLEFNDWVRGGLQRVEMGQLFSLALIYFTYIAFQNKPRIRYIIIIGYMMIFLMFISQVRFQSTVSAVTIIVMIYFMYQKGCKKFWMRFVVLLACIGLLASGVVGEILQSASVTGKYAGSTLARVNTVKHYIAILSDQRAFFGLGLLDIHDTSAYRLMRLDETRLYYLDDIGIFGGLVRFGFLSLIIYGYLFVLAINSCLKCYKNRNDEYLPILFGMVFYMILSCFLQNLFDLQRAFALPFYLSIISYIDCKSTKTTTQSSGCISNEKV